jgi:hypothetical protein
MKRASALSIAGKRLKTQGKRMLTWMPASGMAPQIKTSLKGF